MAKTRAYEIGERCRFDRSNPEYAAALEDELMNLPGFADWVYRNAKGYRDWLKKKEQEAELCGEVQN